MRAGILGLLAGLARAFHAEPLYTTLIGVAVALAVLVFLSGLFRVRTFARDRIAGGPMLIVSALAVLGLCLVWTAVDGLLYWADAPLLSEHLIRALVPSDLELQGLREDLHLGEVVRESPIAGGLLRELLGAPAGPSTPLLPGGVSMALGLLLASLLYYGIAALMGSTLSEMLALQKKPEDILREERRQRLEARAKAKTKTKAAESARSQDTAGVNGAAGSTPGSAAPGDRADQAGSQAGNQTDNQAGSQANNQAGSQANNQTDPWTPAAGALAHVLDDDLDDPESEIDPEHMADGSAAMLPAPIPDDFWGRVYKLGGHFRSYRYVESRFLRWHKPLSLTCFGLLLVGALPASGGYMPVPMWIASAILANALWSLTPARDKKEEDDRERKNKQAGDAGARTSSSALPAFAERAEVASHLRPAPSAPTGPGRADTSPARVHAVSLLDDIAEALGARPLYGHQAAAATAFDTRASVLVATAPESGRQVLTDALSLYAVLADGERVLCIEGDAARAKAAHQRFEERADTTHWKWNVLALNLADRAGTLDPARAQPSLIFADAPAVHRVLCGQSERWQDFLASLGTVVLPDAHRASGAQAGHLAQLIRRLERVARRARTLALGRDLMDRAPDTGRAVVRFLVTAHPGHGNLARYVERVVGHALTVIGPRHDNAPRPRHDTRIVADTWDAGGAHPAMGARDLARDMGYRAELFGYQDLLTEDEREPCTDPDVIIARHNPATQAALALDTMHLGSRPGRGRSASVAVLWQPDTTPMARLWAQQLADKVSANRTADAGRAPERDPLGRALVAWPGAPAIERSHLRATLAECEMRVDELTRMFSRACLQDELRALRADGRLLEYRRRLLDPIAGEVVTVHSVRLSTSHDVHQEFGLATCGESWQLCERATGQVLAELEGERARAAGYPGRVFTARGRRFEVLMDSAQDQLDRKRVLCQQIDAPMMSTPVRSFFIEVIERRRKTKPANLDQRDGQTRDSQTGDSQTGDSQTGDSQTGDSQTRDDGHERDERRREGLRSLGGARFALQHRDIMVTETMTGVRRFDLRGHALDGTSYERPIESRFQTRAAVLGLLPEYLPDQMTVSMNALHAIAHGFSQALPALLHYEPEYDLDIAPLAKTAAWSTPSVVFVDLHPGGAGFAEAVDLDTLRRLCHHALELMRECPAACQTGCPECLHLWTCRAPGQHHQSTDKRDAMTVLDALLG